MKKLLKVVGILICVLIVLAAGALLFLFIKFPRKEAPPQITVQPTPELLQRGAYIANHLVPCLHCHSARKLNAYGSPVVAGTEGQGALFLKGEGLGELYAPNITPFGLKDWSDGEIARAIVSGIDRNGDPLFPIMPYLEFSQFKQEDLFAVIAYIRSLKPIAHEVPKTRLDFPLNLIVRTIPQPAVPDPQVQSNYGRYLTTIANCKACHTPTDEHDQPLPGMMFSGGRNFDIVRSANITPDPETGIGKWSKQDFIAAFKKYTAPEMRQIALTDERNTVMPWIDFSGITEEDLGAIYDYLRTVPPIRHKVEKFPAIPKD